MPAAIVAARIVLAAVFLVAGVAKLLDRAGSRRGLRDFGVPSWLAAPLGIALPIAELIVAAALLPIASAWLGALGALGLLLVFLLGIGINLARGRKPDCHCFGQLYSAPAGWSTLTRNAVLALVAGLVVWQGRFNPGPSVWGWWGDPSTGQRVGLLWGLAVLALIAGEAAFLLQILRQQGRILLRLEALESRLPKGADAPQGSVAPSAGLPIGTTAPSFRLGGLHGETITLEALVAGGKSALLLFANPNCGPCLALMPEIGRWQREHAASLTVAMVSEGTAEDNRPKSNTHGISQVLLQRNREVAEAYHAWGTPAAVLVRPDGSVGSPVAQGADAIRALVAHAAAAPPPLPAQGAVAPANGQNGNGSHPTPRPPVVKIGDPAPPLKLHDLNGKAVTLTDFRGRKTLVLFWNPGCGFCQQMLNDLRAWESDPPAGAPKLLVVSAGTVEANQAMNLRLPVLLDRDFQAGSAFGANGTPMAVLIDAKGRIASGVAAGAQEVFALAGRKPAAATEPVLMVEEGGMAGG